MRASVVSCSVEIDRSPEDVFDYVTDISREFDWNPRTKRVVKLTDGPVNVGTRWEGEWIAGDPMLIDYVAFDRPTSWRSVGRSRGLLVAAEGRVDPTPNGAHLTLRFEVEPRGRLRVIAPLLGWVMRGRERENAAAIKARLERERGDTTGGGSAMTTIATKAGLRGRFGRFVLHYFEMCAPMCVGFAIGDLIYFWAASQFGYSKPFRELPELSVVIVTLTMTAPMVVWMAYRGMPRRPIAEMAAVMPVLGAALLVLGWLSILPRSDLALWEHGLMMPAMLVPMLFRLELYTTRHGQHRSGALASRPMRGAHGR